MAFKDLREYLAACKEKNELMEIAGADWVLQIGALTEAMSERRGPALIFDSIKGYPPGYRVLGNAFSSFTRTSMVLGLPEGLKGIDLLRAWREKMRSFTPVPPKEVKIGTVMENVDEGDAVNLFRFPAPQWHHADGGRFLGTGCAVITQDPDTGRINVGTYRNMIQSENTIFVKMNTGKHGRMAMDKYHSKGKNCPVAISIGHEPSVFFVAQSPLAPDIEEFSYAGWLRGEPLEVIRSDYNGLLIPAHSEIVLEGEIAPLDASHPLKEGPFGEWPGYYADTTVGEVPLMRVHRVLYRKDPIILGVPPMRPPTPYPFAVPFGSAALWDQMEKAGIPEVKGVWGFVSSGQSGLFTAVAIKQRYAGHSKQAGVSAVTCRAGAYGGKFVVVVDDDIDITDAREVLWAMATRCNVKEDVQIIKDIWTTPADPVIPPQERSKRNYISDRIVIDACRPYQWRDEFPLVNVFEKKEKDEMLKKWKIPSV